jgi:hypothetical protein
MQAFVFWHIGNGKMMDVLAPSGKLNNVDPSGTSIRSSPQSILYMA